MTNNNNHLSPTVYLGAPITVASERTFLERLRRDVEGPALIIGNFFPFARQQRQVDFLIWTPHRTVMVELKALNAERPLTGGPNGHWYQAGPGAAHELDTNPIQQALSAGHAIADSMRDFKRQRPETPAATYRHFDTVVCFTPAVPPGSTIDEHDYVPVLAYAELVDQLAGPGTRTMPWAPSDWTAYLRYLHVYPESDDAPGALDARQAIAERSSYRVRFEQQLTRGLHELVAFPATDLITDEDVQVDQLLGEVQPGAVIVLSGPSGAGKSHHARHAALDLSRSGANVIWANAGEYDDGELGTLLAQAVAPFTAANHRLILGAPADGERSVVIVDGLAADTDRSRLLEQLAALCHRFSVAVVVTANADVNLPGVPTTSVRLSTPDDGLRTDLIRSYGLNPALVTAAVRTPFDIATLAAVRADLAPDAQPWEIHDAFITSRTGSAAVRAGLRVIAAVMIDGIRSTMRRTDAWTLLERRTDLGAHDLDRVFTNPLLTTGQGHIAFVHDLHRDLLAAEHVTASARSAAALGDSLVDPRRGALQVMALRREPDPVWISEVLSRLARHHLYVDAATGELGEVARLQIRGEIAAALAEAAAFTDPSHYELHGELIAATWTCRRPRSRRDRALMLAAGDLLRQGEFLEEAIAVLDRTDQLMAHAIERQRAEGSNTPITDVVTATIGSFGGDDAPPVGDLIRPMTSHGSSPVAGAAHRLLRDIETSSWSRLFVALSLADVEADPEVIPDLLLRAWRAGGYHLRLHALHRARLCMYPNEHLREQVADVVETFDVSNNWALSTVAVEILHASGRIETLRTVEQITAEILELVEHPDDPERQQLAYGAFISQFEDDIVGPYSEAVDGLDGPTRRTLLVMAAQARHNSHALPLIINELAANATDDELERAVRRHAEGFPDDRMMVNDAVDTYVSAIRAWARIRDRLPDPPAAASSDERAWRFVGELLFHDARGGAADGPEAARIWDAMRLECPGAIAAVLEDLAFPSVWNSAEAPPLADLLERYAPQVKAVAAWSLTHRDEMTSIFGHFRQPPELFLFSLLGCCGDAETIGMIEPYVDDPQVGRWAVDAIRSIRSAN